MRMLVALRRLEMVIHGKNPDQLRIVAHDVSTSGNFGSRARAEVGAMNNGKSAESSVRMAFFAA